jgi:hypothetical protein
MSAWLNSATIILAAIISGYAAVKAGRAEKNSRPVANGFTGYVLDDLKEIRRMMIDHLITHDVVSHPVTEQNDNGECS